MVLIEILERSAKSDSVFKICVHAGSKETLDTLPSETCYVHSSFALRTDYTAFLDVLKSSLPASDSKTSNGARVPDYLSPAGMKESEKQVEFEYTRQSPYDARGACVRSLDRFVRTLMREHSIKHEWAVPRSADVLQRIPTPSSS